MRKVKTPLKVKITRVENPLSPWEAPFLGQIGDVEYIDRAAHGGFVLGVLFPEELNKRVYGDDIPKTFQSCKGAFGWGGFMAYTDTCYGTVAEVIEGNPHTAYYGEWTDELTEKWLAQK